MSLLTQTGRTIQVLVEGIEIPDKVVARSLFGSEYISRLFEFHIDLIHQKAFGPLHFQDLLGRSIGASLQVSGGERRHFHGIITQLARTGEDREFRYFRATMRPALWRLTRMWHSRIFQDLSALQILTTGAPGEEGRVPPILQGIQFDSRNLSDSESVSRNYCVQYRESDFNFASRLMEEEGICYFFRHTENAHVMVLADARQAYPSFRDPMRWFEGSLDDAEQGRICEWEKIQDLTSGRWNLRDYHFQQPNRTLDGSLPIIDSVDLGAAASNGYRRIQLAMAGNQTDLEISDYPAGYAKFFDEVNRTGGSRVSGTGLAGDLTSAGDRALRLRMEREESRSVRFSGASRDTRLAPGCRFILERHAEDNGEYLTIAVEHSFSEAGVRSGSERGFHYTNRVTCVPAAFRYLPFDPDLRHPLVGAQTAFVVGPRQDEVFTDRYGRVKVRFHWDRAEAAPSDCSCWLRVAQPWAGRGWGHQWIPRVGNEVLVDFLEGDPDQPIVVGSVYNESNRFPFRAGNDDSEDGRRPRPTRSGIKTRTIPNGPPTHSNELRFEDQAGHEQVFLHSQGRMDLRARGSHFETCGGSHETRIGGVHNGIATGDQNTFVYRDENTHMQGSKFELIDADLYCKIGGVAVHDYHHASTTVYRDIAEIHAKRLKLEALEEICLLVGNHYILINHQGIRIDGVKVSINCGGDPPAPVADPAFVTPIDALPADTNSSTGHGSGGSSEPRYHEGYTIALPHAPHTVRPRRRRPELPVPPPTPVAPAHACSIRTITVECSHGRRRAVNGRLQTVEAGGDADILHVEVAGVSPCGEHPRIRMSGAAARMIHANTVAQPVRALSPARLWNAECRPTTYHFTGECCSGSVPSVDVDAYPGRQIPYRTPQWPHARPFFEWVFTNGLGTLLEMGMVASDFQMQFPNGNIDATLGWREHTDWRAFFGGRVEVRFDPLFRISFERALAPAWIIRILRRARRLGRWVERLIAFLEQRLGGTLRVEISAKLTGSAERNSPGPAACTGRLECRATLQPRLNIRDVEVGSDSWLDWRPHLSITVMGSGSFSLRPEGPISWSDADGVGVDVHLRGSRAPMALHIQVRGLGPITRRAIGTRNFGDPHGTTSENETVNFMDPVNTHYRFEIVGPGTIEI